MERKPSTFWNSPLLSWHCLIQGGKGGEEVGGELPASDVAQGPSRKRILEICVNAWWLKLQLCIAKICVTRTRSKPTLYFEHKFSLYISLYFLLKNNINDIYKEKCTSQITCSVNFHKLNIWISNTQMKKQNIETEEKSSLPPFLGLPSLKWTY